MEVSNDDGIKTDCDMSAKVVNGKVELRMSAEGIGGDLIFLLDTKAAHRTGLGLIALSIEAEHQNMLAEKAKAKKPRKAKAKAT